MRANELRIGNWHNWKGGDAPDEGYTEQLKIEDFEELKTHPDRYRPIPLTEEWHLRLNDEQWDFVGYGTRIIYQHKVYKAIKLEWIPSDQIDVYFNDNLINAKDYVHELQNLFHSLTNEELKTN